MLTGLQTDVMTRHSDPRIGETTYGSRASAAASRRQPPPALFQVPADYKIVEGDRAGVMRKPKE